MKLRKLYLLFTSQGLIYQPQIKAYKLKQKAVRVVKRIKAMSEEQNRMEYLRKYYGINPRSDRDCLIAFPRTRLDGNTSYGHVT